MYWCTSALVQIEDEKEPGAGCPACPFALGHGGGLGALAVQLQLAPVEVSSVYVARREEAKPHICGEPQAPPRARAPSRLPAGSAFILSSDLEIVTQRPFTGSPQHPFWGGRASSPKSGRLCCLDHACDPAVTGRCSRHGFLQQRRGRWL